MSGLCGQPQPPCERWRCRLGRNIKATGGMETPLVVIHGRRHGKVREGVGEAMFLFSFMEGNTKELGNKAGVGKGAREGGDTLLGRGIGSEVGGIDCF